MFNDYKFSDTVTESVAVNVCENCGKACDTLIDLPSWNFKACETCAEEAAREDEREALAIRKAREAAARTFAPKPCVNCKTRMSRWDSLYCSDTCRREFSGSLRADEPRYACIGNGLYVRTAAPRKRRTR